MRAVIDTNVFIESLSRISPYHVIFQMLVNGGFFVCVSTSILLEYEEVVYRLHRRENADKLMNFLDISPSVIFVSPSYRFNLIAADPDDNKFVDCAIAANADHIVTSDRHFDVLQASDFLQPRTIRPEESIKQYLHSESSKFLFIQLPPFV